MCLSDSAFLRYGRQPQLLCARCGSTIGRGGALRWQHPGGATTASTWTFAARLSHAEFAASRFYHPDCLERASERRRGAGRRLAADDLSAQPA